MGLGAGMCVCMCVCVYVRTKYVKIKTHEGTLLHGRGDCIKLVAFF